MIKKKKKTIAQDNVKEVSVRLKIFKKDFCIN